MVWQKIIHYIKESWSETSSVSNTRMNSTIMTCTVAICTMYITVTAEDPANHWELYVGLFAVAMGMKAWQKFAERKQSTTKSEEEESDVQNSGQFDGINKSRI